MKNIRLLVITSLFSSFLIGCGMKGPLYQSPEKAQAMLEKQQTAVQLPAINAATDSHINQLDKQESVTADKADSPFTPSAQLLAIAPSQFTLQLAAMDSQASLQQFITTHNLPQKDVYIYQTMHNGNARYIVIFGEYKSRQSALIARRTLPGSFANIDAWVKKYQVVHQELLLSNQ